MKNMIIDTLPVINEEKIEMTLAKTGASDPVRVREVLAKAAEINGLSFDDAAVLSGIENSDLLHELFTTARTVKETIYGKRLVLFAPLYISNLCSNECVYCAFRAKNKEINRRVLGQDEIAREVKALVEQGNKRILLVAGESYPSDGFSYIIHAIETIYAVTSGAGNIRRINVNVAPLHLDEFKLLKEAKIGTYQVFQETYHHGTYKAVHLGGKKRDYDWRVTAMDRAMEAGIDDVGIGVLFGLYNWRFELGALLQHCNHLERHFGVGPHTISVPRIEPATGSPYSTHAGNTVSDDDFRKIVAILRLAVPYTGIIMSTRESPQMRRETFALGVSQISAASRTNPGGYACDDDPHNGQFSLGDHRPLDEVIRDVASMGYMPSFCTGCYRLGRTGADFMDLAKPGDIKTHCEPNAVSTFQEYLLDYGTEQTRTIGEQLIEKTIASMSGISRTRTEKLVAQVREGKRDVYC